VHDAFLIRLEHEAGEIVLPSRSYHMETGMDRNEDIKARAHQIWEEDGRPDGMHDSHWKQAEDELNVAMNSGEIGGVMGGQKLDTTPEVNAGSVSASSDNTLSKKRKG